jgi:hypothetical protein
VGHIGSPGALRPSPDALHRASRRACPENRFASIKLFPFGRIGLSFGQTKTKHPGTDYCGNSTKQSAQKNSANSIEKSATGHSGPCTEFSFNKNYIKFY